jgi:hypothetical protein
MTKFDTIADGALCALTSLLLLFATIELVTIEPREASAPVTVAQADATSASSRV